MSKSRKQSALLRRSDRDLPGVGIYTPKEKITNKNAPIFSLGKKIPERKKSKMGAASPGPAAYLSRNMNTFRSYS